MPEKINIFWFRRDLRLHDNHGLFQALKYNIPVLPLFIFDKNILDDLDNKNDKRVNFIYNEVLRIKSEIEDFGSSMLIYYGEPIKIFKNLILSHKINAVYTNEDYEPYAIKRDYEIESFLKTQNIVFLAYKDQVVFAKNDILKADGKPYTVFTPYSKKWKEKLNITPIPDYTNSSLFNNLVKTKPFPHFKIEELGFKKTSISCPDKAFNIDIIQNYHKTRDFPAVNGTTRLSLHLRFGTISIRKLVKAALQFNEVYLNELIWREFYMMILFHFPHVVTSSFKKQYDNIAWLNNEVDFENWKNGTTGFPLVDAGMRELNETGFMHNRVRMVTASFLVKHLLIDWRWGENYFAQKLFDYELASNNGGWQWAAGSGCDAAPYFRIFNPETQWKKFDKHGDYIRKWIPEINTINYMKPIIDHKFARERALKVYKQALK